MHSQQFTDVCHIYKSKAKWQHNEKITEHAKYKGRRNIYHCNSYIKQRTQFRMQSICTINYHLKTNLIQKPGSFYKGAWDGDATHHSSRSILYDFGSNSPLFLKIKHWSQCIFASYQILYQHNVGYAVSLSGTRTTRHLNIYSTIW